MDWFFKKTDDSFCISTGKPVGETILFFGCRNRSEDYLYEEEFQECVDEGLLTVSHPGSLFSSTS